MSQTSELLWYIVGITAGGVGALLLAFVVSRALRKRLRAETRTAPFTIQDLREMRDEGDITQHEYEAMRAAVVGQTLAGTPGPNAKGPKPPAVRDSYDGDAEDPACDHADDEL